ncbi:DUF410 domain-containing protein [archaeon]|nr:MAG: DUF410 domain-containing protein [archaeon]
MATRKKGTGGNVKREVDLTSMVQSGPQGAYEALQLYRSRAMRLKAKNDIAGALKAVSEGSVVLLQNGYENAGAECADIFVGLLTETSQAVSEETKQTIFEIDSKFAPRSGHRVEFLKSCIKWTIACGERDLGDAQLHVTLGGALWDGSGNAQDKSSIYHFAAGEAPGALLEKILGSFTAEQRVLREQAVVLGVVHFLSLENLRDARALYTQFLARTGAQADGSELLRFADFVLQTARREAGPLFKGLVNAFASALDFDDTVPTLLTGPVASKLFGIKPKVNPMMSMLQSMMS